ncbi:peptidase S41 family protein [Mytilinidion resinicola]|uniref:Peptidase S41 family protein n=1 Tax=Mytilinidion resinicola TaxID=574789 RepID=A0A6A6Y1M8_9PEZI|nr:peptidase S41 family protein [Mytilinidion resinicola]KAF2801707.1 peptidase S41 family protein [Mytilinidion resinicola]
MRSSIFLLPTLLGLVVAQTELTGILVPTQEPEPSATETVSGPISTAKACAQVAELVSDSDLTTPSVEAELAHACLLSVPFDSDAGTLTIEMVKRLAEFQSTVSYLKSPPEAYFNDPVDIMKGLQDIQDNIGKYKDEFTFETDIASLIGQAHDGHFNFNGMAFNGAFRWRRSRQIALVSGSQDGGIPKLYAIQDFNKTNAGYTPSAVTKINGEDAVTFIGKEAPLSTYHDPDTRWNAMFYMQAAESYGYFTNPRYYPGPTTNITFENGTEHSYINAAVVLDPQAWSYIEDGKSFYQTYITPSSTGNSKIKKRDPSFPPTLLEHPRDLDLALTRRYVPINYPEPVVAHSASDVNMGGYFINDYGVLMMQTFSTESVSDALEFQSVIQTFISEAVSRKTKKIIIDVRDNGGGKIFLGYDAYKQFFPTEEPQLQSRYRAADANDLLGEKISTLGFSTRNGDLFTSPFNYHSYDDAELKPFTSWDDMTPPTSFNNDNFTNLLRYNLSNPLTSTSSEFSIGVTVTGYLDRANFTTQPFKPEDIVILSDGICASTCSLFAELMHTQSGVRTIALGGRPQLGPMQAVGGTKGSLVLQSTYLASLSSFVLQEFATTQSEATAWSGFLLGDFGIAVNAASVNFQDNIRKGDEKAGVPTQFVNDTASCRLWMTPQMYLNVTAVWEEVAAVAWGKGGALDEGRCVGGSATSQQAVASSAASASASGGKAKPTGNVVALRQSQPE